MPWYRYDGNVNVNDGSDVIRVVDAENIIREVPKGAAVMLTTSQLGDIDDDFRFSVVDGPTQVAITVPERYARLSKSAADIGSYIDAFTGQPVPIELVGVPGGVADYNETVAALGGKVSTQAFNDAIASLSGGSGSPPTTDASLLTSGTLAFARLPTGTTATTVAKGDAPAAAATAAIAAVRGGPNGIAPLDGNARVPAVNLGSGTASATTFLAGDGTFKVPAGTGGSTTVADKSLGNIKLTDAAATDVKQWESPGQIVTDNAADRNLWIPTPCDILGVTPEVNLNHPPRGQSAIGDVEVWRAGVLVGSLWTSDASRPIVPADAVAGTEVLPAQNASLQSGDKLRMRRIRGGFTQEAASILGDYQQPSGATSGSTFVVNRPVDPATTQLLSFDVDNPRVLIYQCWRNNQSTDVTAPSNFYQLGDAASGNMTTLHRHYAWWWWGDGATSWTFNQTGVASVQSQDLAWCQPPASGSPIDGNVNAVASTASTSFTIPAITTQGTDRMLLALVATSSSATRTPPSGWGNTGLNGVQLATSGRCGIVRRWPGNAQGAMGPWTGTLDSSLVSSVKLLAFAPRASDPGEDFSMAVRYRKTA